MQNMARLVKLTEKTPYKLEVGKKPTSYASVGFQRTSLSAMDLTKGQRTKRRASYTFTMRMVELRCENFLL